MLKALVELVRAPAALTVPGDVLAGAVAAGDLRPARMAGLSAASVCIYWGGMALNDWADREIDAVERPERPIPSGRVSAGTAFGLAAGLTAAGLALAGCAGGRSALATSAVLAATAWSYDLKAKNTAAGPVFMAAARALDVLVGAGDQRRRAWAPALAVGTHILGVTAMSRGEVHGSTPLPARGALGATSAIAVATIGRPGRGAAASGPAGLAATAVLTGLFAQAVAPAQITAAREPSGPKLRRAVGAGIHGLVPLQAAWCARAGAPRLGAALAVALPLAKALARKVSPT
ncbi:4-hydroxybenzoate polyprenyltransferase [Kribbella sp. ALI-6-A]|uniref:SCO3242 family prenyltransferase n=1 Tax=Kribbella sp. ALI-6-A TaxID=1933817 RepID=UPI00097C7D2E|nr:UbiA family prenyltransferase [Kribbella sp. ALI-6-A]ONI76709.1 4-hydroxybenzoate polyprenyltransferase [Kribbella sp. ALI-6-A]